MLLGGLVGVLVDRFDRRRTVLFQTAYVLPTSTALAALILSGRIDAWMVYPLVLVIGVGNVIDITARRALLFDLVGRHRLTSALSLEAASLSMGTLLSGLLGGALIDTLGIGEAFLLSSALYAAAFLLMSLVPTLPARIVPGASNPSSPRRDLHDLLQVLRSNRALVSILGITTLVNIFFWTFPPLIPVFADDLGVGAFLAGLLASAPGFGMVVGSSLIAARRPGRRGRIFVLGSSFAMALLAAFALIPWYPGAFLALVAVGLAIAGFSTMQSVLALEVSSPDMRGRAVGMVSMAIGALPFGMLLLGLLAEAVGPAAAVAASGFAGLAALLVWISFRPEVRRLD